MGSFLLSNADIDGADSDNRTHVARLRELATELINIAERIECVEEAITARSRVTDFLRDNAIFDMVAKSKPDTSTLVRFAERLQASRSARDEFFKGDIFGEPAWEILLELFVSKSNDRRLSVTGLCSGISVPQTTALRYVELLERQGLLTREKSESDLRVTWVELTSEGNTKMRRCLANWRRCLFEQY